MDETLLDLLFPSLVNVSVIAFSLLITLPRLRFWLRAELDRRRASNKMRTSEFFAFTYYIAITQYLDYIAIVYLLGLLIAILSPLAPSLKYVSYIIIILATSSLLFYSVGAAISSLKKAIASSSITV